MLKYAQITNEETKECSVGLGNPEDIFSEELIPAKTHFETVPAEYDENGNIIKEEQRIEVIDEEEYTKTITIGDWYKSIGMEEMDVEEAYNGTWYVKGYAPEKPTPTTEEIRQQREAYYKEHCDPLTCEKIRKTAMGNWTDEDEAEYVNRMNEIKAEVEKLYPYPTEEKNE